MRKRRIGIAFFYHESHSFTPLMTTVKDFKKEALLKGEEIIGHYLGTKTEIGGALEFLKSKEEVEIIPILCAAAIPSGVVEQSTYEEIEKEMLRITRDVLPLDGFLLALHGAMVVKNVKDPEENLLSKIRNILGPLIPIATTLDMHANVCEKMIEHTPLHFGFKTYPHIDMYDQGYAAASCLYNCLLNNVQYYAAFEKIPMLLPSLNMRTEEGPMKEMIGLAKLLEENEDITNVSIFGGFPYADIESAGASVLVIGKTQEAADQAAKFLAKKFWEVRNDFIVQLPNVEEAIHLAVTTVERPVVLADISDNPLSCGSGDTTELLSAMLEKNLTNSLFGGLYDPESIEICKSAGEGASVDLLLGGKVSPEFGRPVKVRAEILKISDGVFYNSGPFNQYLKVDLESAVHLKVDEMDIVLIGRSMSANDPEMFRHLGIEPKDKEILGMKVKNHFRAAFDPIIERVIYVDAPGVSTNRLSDLNYQNIPRPIWPLDKVDY